MDDFVHSHPGILFLFSSEPCEDKHTYSLCFEDIPQSNLTDI